MDSSRRLRISVFTTIPKGIYSGGRYLSMMLAYSLSRAGAAVTYVTDNVPIFDRDFAPFDAVSPIDQIVTPDFNIPAELESDWVIVIPTGSFESEVYDAALRHAQRSRARVALLSFETPNWYDSVSPYPRSPMPTENWRRVVASGGVILTIAEEGVAWARDYFGAARKDLLIDHWHPPINDLAAEQAVQSLSAAGQGTADDRKRITMFTRIEDQHKGAYDLFALPPNLFDGHILSLVFGRGRPHAYLDALRQHFAPARDFAIEAHDQISDEAKFRLLGRSRMLLFPSYFEGYGYPPVEAAAMGVPTVAYDLPLLREVAGDAIVSVPLGDTSAFAEAVRSVLADPSLQPGESIRARLRHDAGTRAAGERALEILQRGQSLPVYTAPAPARMVDARAFVTPPAIEARESRARSGPRLDRLTTTMRSGRLTVDGSVIDAPQGARLTFAMVGAAIADCFLSPTRNPVETVFATSGIVHRWGSESQSGTADDPTGSARLDIALAGPGGDIVELGFALVEPDWATLLAWPDGPARAAVGYGEFPAVLIVVDPDRLADDIGASSALAAVGEAFDRLHRRTRAIVVDSARDPADAAGLDVDFLPRFHELSTVTRVAAGRIAAAAIASGEPVLFAPGTDDLVPPGTTALRIASSASPIEASDLLVCAPGLAEDRVMLDPDPRLGRRSFADRSGRGAMVLLVPAAPIDQVAEELRSSLARLALEAEQLEVAIPSRLWKGRTAPYFGLGHPIEELSEADLMRRLSISSQAVALTLDDAADPFTLGLLAELGVAAVPFSIDTPLRDQLAETVLADPSAGSPIAALVATHFPAPDGPRPFAALGGARSAHPLPAELPLLAVANQAILSFSSTTHAADDCIMSGWGLRDIYGIRMAASRAVLAFKLLETPLSGQEIELFVRIADVPRPGASLRLTLNGTEVLAPRPVAAGYSILRAPIPRSAWSRLSMQQVLTIEHDQGERRIPNDSICVIAVSLRAPPPARPALPASAGVGSRRSPLLVPSFWEGSEPRTVLNATDHGNFGPLVPTVGWANPDPGGLWSDSKSSALTIRPPATIERGVLEIVLAGMPHNLPAEQWQRVTVSANDQPIAETLFPRNGDARLAVTLSASRLQAAPLERLVLDLPDAEAPAELGQTRDPRQLALALRTVTIRRFANAIGEARFVKSHKDQIDGAIALPAGCSALALRFVGRGEPPAGTLALGRYWAAVRPLAIGDGWWDACLALPELEAMAPVWIGWVPDERPIGDARAVTDMRTLGIERCELWTNRPGTSEGSADHRDLVIRLAIDRTGSHNQRVFRTCERLGERHWVDIAGGPEVSQSAALQDEPA